MEQLVKRATKFFDLPLRMQSRLLTLLAALLLLPSYFLPLWRMTLFSNQFPDGLRLVIYSHELKGGQSAARDDLREINTLNHYIGMRPLLESDFSEFKWIPLVVGFFFILALRAVVMGKMANLVDLAVLFGYFGLFSLWSFYSRLSEYGHNLDPQAPVKVAPFIPPLIGSQRLANFTVHSLPGAGSYFMVAFPALLAVAILISAKGEPMEASA